MKYITESDLRDLYKKEPFDAYEMDPETRLTPGARQFLSDIGIHSFRHDVREKKANARVEHSVKIQASNWQQLIIHSKMKSVEAQFLLTVEELLNKDACLAQGIVNLYSQFSSVRKAVLNKEETESLCCNECTGIKANNFSDNLDDCFEITDFHMLLEKSRDILIVHRLRCALQEIEPAVMELMGSIKEENEQYQHLIGKVNQIINSLSQLICVTVGGGQCQRKTQLLNTVISS